MPLRRKRNRSTFLGAAFIAALVATGCSHPPADTYQGYVEGKFVYVASPQSGRLDHLAVARGETVAVKQPLFAFDREPEASVVHNAQRLLENSQSRLADLETGKRPPEIDVTRAQLTQALAEKKQADQILESDKKQYAGRRHCADRSDHRAGGGGCECGPREGARSRPGRGCAAGARPTDQGAAEPGRGRSRLACAEAQWRLDQKDIDSPRQGLVFDTLYREGEWVAAGNPVVQLLPPENMEVRFFVPETVVGKLKVGESVQVQCDGCASKVSAAITFISPQCEYTPPVIYSNENRAKLVFMIIAKPPDEKAALLHPGQPVEVTVE